MVEYEVNVYYNGGVEEMGYRSDDDIDTVLKCVKRWLRSRYRRFDRLGYGVKLANLEYAELKGNGAYHCLDTFHWEWDRVVD